MNKILITGTAGFIGFHLVERLIKEGNCEIVGLDNINDYYNINLKIARLKETGINKEKLGYNKFVSCSKSDQYRFIKLDLTDKKNIYKLFKKEKFEYVINIAAQAGVRYSIENPYSYIDSNILGFLNILEACRLNEVKNVIYASSSSVYGNNSKLPFEENECCEFPVSLYAVTKKTNELMAYTYYKTYNMNMTGLRFFTAYGPWGRPDMAYYLFTDRIVKGKPITLYEKGNLKRDFTYVDDIISVLIDLVNKVFFIENKDAQYSIFNLGGSNPEKVINVVKILEKYLDKRAIIKYDHKPTGDVIYTYADISLAQKVLNFNPTTNIEMGLKHFIDWYKNYHKII